MAAHAEHFSDAGCQEALLDKHEVRNHLRLGIRFDDAEAYVKQLLACESKKCCSRINLSKLDVNAVREKLKNHTEYKADDKDDGLGNAGHGWIQKEYPKKLTGYDLLVAIKCWLREKNKQRQMHDLEGNQDEQSVCEVLQDSKSFYKGCGVGQAEVFISHVQGEHPADTLRTMAQAHRREGNLAHIGKLHAFQWVDYFSLRQLANDFNPREICNLIASIGTTIVGADSGNTYFKRSFCVLESFATIDNSKMLLFPESVNVFGWFKSDTIKSENAESRSPRRRDEIKEWMRKMEGGFEKVDQTLIDEVRKAEQLRSRQKRLRCMTSIPIIIFLLLVVGGGVGAVSENQVLALALLGGSLLLSLWPLAGLFGCCLNRCGVRPSRNKCLKSWAMVGAPNCGVVWCSFYLMAIMVLAAIGFAVAVIIQLNN